MKRAAHQRRLAARREPAELLATCCAADSAAQQMQMQIQAQGILAGVQSAYDIPA